ncbi:hypothetical protein BDV96DRAFT_77094 [Lophiotrema nucula]|uniref:DUF7730 domain-containing protein n=1 Tax=Lophiotrema nucula TaxID=690887 RepID=A0A6A5Z9E1_9PLEO|nr:hypothetical protein BDV96DRAFT_77094 [Lophiotrema nucula]
MVSAVRSRKLPARLESSPAAKSRSRAKGKSNLIAQPTKPRKALHASRRTPLATSEPPSRPPSPSIWREPANPQATMLGIPTELRLQIYEHVFHSTLMHIHRHEFGEFIGGSWHPPRFFWTACRQPNPDHPMLCANPKYSALCNEEDRCTYRPDDPPESSGAVALRRTCRLIHQETQNLAQRGSTISIHPKDLDSWLFELKKVAPKQLESIRRVTLMGTDTWRTPLFTAFRRLKMLENLEAIAFQGQVAKWTLLNLQSNKNAPEVRWGNWQLLNWLKDFPCNVKVVAEGLVWNKSRPRWVNSPDKDHQVVVRIVRDAYEGDQNASASWDDQHVDVEVQRSDLINYKRNAKWRMWWRAKEVKHFI